MGAAGPTFGAYRLIRPLAKGGMAEVHLAESAVGRRVVVKRMRRQIAADPVFVKMFLREAAIAVRMQHGNIAQVFDFGEIDGEYFLVMEYVEGFSLSQLQEICREHGIALPPAFSVSVVAEVARALDHAHHLPGEDGANLGIVHRDVSPQNVMLSLDGQVKLVDFGIAKGRDNQQLTGPGVARGKYRYFAPEQVKRAPVDGRTDVHACGVVLYELLAGRPPYDGSLMEVLEDITIGAFASPADVAPGVPEALDRIVVRAMATDPSQRHQRARDLERDLSVWLRANEGAYGEPQRAAFLTAVGRRASGGDEVTATVVSPHHRPTDRRGTALAVVGVVFAALVALGLAVGRREPPEPPSIAPTPLPSPAAGTPAAAEAPVPSRQELIRRAPPPPFRFVPGPQDTLHATLRLQDIALVPARLPAATAEVAAGAAMSLEGAYRYGGVANTRTRELLYWLRTPDGRLVVDMARPDRSVRFDAAGTLHLMGLDPGDPGTNTERITAVVSPRTRVPVDGRDHVIGADGLPGAWIDVPSGRRLAIELDGPPDLTVGYLVRKPPFSFTFQEAIGFFGVLRPGEIWTLTERDALRFFVLTDDPSALPETARVILHPLDALAPGMGEVIGHQRLDVEAP